MTENLHLDEIDTCFLAFANMADIRELESRIATRKHQLKAAAIESLAVNDQIETCNVSPKYLAGVRCTVVQLGTGTKAKPRVKVRVDHPEYLDPRASKYVRSDGTMNVLVSTVRPV